MTTISLNKAQKAAMKQLQKDHIVVINSSTASALITKGLAQRVSISPEPLTGTAVSLTTKGHSWRA